MLDLQSRVHFHEPDAVRAKPLRCVGDELDRPRAFVAHGLGRSHRGAAHRLAGLLVHAGSRGFLDHLLVAPLERAVALEQVDDIAVAVAEHLHLDMARREDVFLDQHAVVAERARRLALGAFERVVELPGLVDSAHALAAAARNRLDQHWIADRIGFLLEVDGS